MGTGLSGREEGGLLSPQGKGAGESAHTVAHYRYPCFKGNVSCSFTGRSETVNNANRSFGVKCKKEKNLGLLLTPNKEGLLFGFMYTMCILVEVWNVKGKGVVTTD